MLKTLILALMLLLPVFTFAQNTGESKVQSGDLTVFITGLKSDKGDVKIALSDFEEDFSSRNEAFMSVSIKIENGKAKWIFKSFPFGEYAIKFYHDGNGNNQLDTNFLGIPKESFGFSNNVRGAFGPPKYEDAKFLFNSDAMTIEIKVK